MYLPTPHKAKASDHIAEAMKILFMIPWSSPLSMQLQTVLKDCKAFEVKNEVETIKERDDRYQANKSKMSAPNPGPDYKPFDKSHFPFFMNADDFDLKFPAQNINADTADSLAQAMSRVAETFTKDANQASFKKVKESKPATSIKIKVNAAPKGGICWYREFLGQVIYVDTITSSGRALRLNCGKKYQNEYGTIPFTDYELVIDGLEHFVISITKGGFPKGDYKVGQKFKALLPLWPGNQYVVIDGEKKGMYVNAAHAEAINAKYEPKVKPATDKQAQATSKNNIAGRQYVSDAISEAIENGKKLNNTSRIVISFDGSEEDKSLQDAIVKLVENHNSKYSKEPNPFEPEYLKAFFAARPSFGKTAFTLAPGFMADMIMGFEQSPERLAKRIAEIIDSLDTTRKGGL